MKNEKYKKKSRLLARATFLLSEGYKKDIFALLC